MNERIPDDLLDAPDRRRQDEDEDSEDVELDGIEEELNEDLD